MSTWRYAQNGQHCGPVETSALHALIRSGMLAPETLVCKEGAADWVPACTLPEFAGAVPSGGEAPPVMPVAGVPPAPGPADPDAADIEKNKVMAVLAYIGLLFLVPLLAAPESRFARYHTNQGIVLFLATIALGGASTLLMFIPFVGCVVSFVPFVVGGGAIVLMVLGIINAASGLYKPLPLIGHFQLMK